jgi:hypothetical protein
VFLSGAKPDEGAAFLGITADQVAAKAIAEFALPSIELTVEEADWPAPSTTRFRGRPDVAAADGTQSPGNFRKTFRRRFERNRARRTAAAVSQPVDSVMDQVSLKSQLPMATRTALAI